MKISERHNLRIAGYAKAQQAREDEEQASVQRAKDKEPIHPAHVTIISLLSSIVFVPFFAVGIYKHSWADAFVGAAITWAMGSIVFMCYATIKWLWHKYIW